MKNTQINPIVAIAAIAALVLVIFGVYWLRGGPSGSASNSAMPPSVSQQLSQVTGGGTTTAPKPNTSPAAGLPGGMSPSLPGSTGGGPPMIMTPGGGR